MRILPPKNFVKKQIIALLFKITHNIGKKCKFMIIILKLLLIYCFNLSADVELEEEVSPTTVSLQAPNIPMTFKKEKVATNLGYGYRSNSSVIKSEFAGKAFYKMAVDQNSSSSSYITAGAKVHRQSMKLKELAFENQMKASAQIGFNQELDSKSLHLEINQPIYDNKKQFSPILEMSYDVKF
jgi:hypothetical protein